MVVGNQPPIPPYFWTDRSLLRTPTMKSLSWILTLLTVVLTLPFSTGFAGLSWHARERTALCMATDRRMGELTSNEEKVFDLLQSLHDSKFSFRIVVVGNGAILETTSVLGPALSVAQSPKTGKNLMTLASDDKSFEFHLQLADVAKIAILEKETPMKTMRIIRILKSEDESMCSLILADPSEAAVKWFRSLQQDYGETIDLM